MIDLRELIKYQYLDEEIKIICTDGQEIIGVPDAVDDEEESGLGEPGITVCTRDKVPVGVGLSEIESIIVLDKKTRVFA